MEVAYLENLIIKDNSVFWVEVVCLGNEKNDRPVTGRFSSYFETSIYRVSLTNSGVWPYGLIRLRRHTRPFT